MSTDQGPHGLEFHNDGISFNPAGAGECELCDSLSANCSFFLVFQSAPLGSDLQDTSHSSTIRSILLSCRRIPFPPHYALRYLRTRGLSPTAARGCSSNRARLSPVTVTVHPPGSG